MLYKSFNNLKLSQLGMGNMRLPTIGEHGPIDEEKAQLIIDKAYESGINYFDTAYRYHGGESETFIGKALKKYPRESWYLASKMPGHMMNYKDGKLGFQGYLQGESFDSISQIFEEQLQKCGVEYFDFYMLHNVCETAYDFYTNEELGVVDYLLAQKKAGRIRHLGISAHARVETLQKFLDKYDCFEFAQIQLNYLDWVLQDAKGKYELLTSQNIPVWVMEPCRGGSLAKLDKKTEASFKALRPDDSIASWAFRFIKDLPNVQVVLSGMTELSQLEDNLKTFSGPAPMTNEEKALIKKAVEKLVDLVPCTACRYCCEACPQGLDIPKLISIYNEISFDNSPLLNFVLNAMAPEELPSNCLSCGDCSKLCPQNIDIPDIMSKLDEVISSGK